MNENGVYTLEEFMSICNADEVDDRKGIQLLYNFYIAELYGTPEDVLKEAKTYYWYTKMKLEDRLN